MIRLRGGEPTLADGFNAAKSRLPAILGYAAISATVGVVLAVSNYRDTRGAETVEELTPLLGKVRAALMGWTPDIIGGRPFQFLQGDVLDYDASTLLWTDVYQTQHFIGVTP